MPVKHVVVTPAENGLRLGRWFKIHYPDLPFIQLQKKCRKGEVRLNGKRVKANDKLESNMVVRVPPLKLEYKNVSDSLPCNSKEAKFIQGLIIYKNPYIFALNKPAGLATQGGTKVQRHIDALAHYLSHEETLCNISLVSVQKPRLIHRLDKDTSGVLLLARTKEVAVDLMKAFRSRKVEKIYWAVVVGCPKKYKGIVDVPLLKEGVGGREKVIVHPKGRKAVTEFQVLQRLGKVLTLLALRPRTGRTHQLRVHMAHMGIPILGDGKYGGKKALICDEAHTRKMHLHARRIALPSSLWVHCKTMKDDVHITADLPEHMTETFHMCGWKKDVALFDTSFEGIK